MNDHILEAVKTIEHYNDYISSTADRLKELVVESLSLTETVHDIQKKLGDDWTIDFRYRGTFDGWECLLSCEDTETAGWVSSGYETLWEAVEDLAQGAREVLKELEAAEQEGAS